MKRNRTPILVLCCFVILTVSSAAGAASSVPRIADENLNPSELSKFIDERQLVLLHDEQPAKTPSGKQQVRYVTSLMLVDTGLESARRTVTDFETYPDFLPTLNDVTVTSESNDTQLIDMQLELRLGVVNPTLYYTLKYTYHENGDITWRRTEGDVQASYGRWEFFPVSDTQTLLAYTTWSDFSGLGLAVDTVLWAQPDLKLAIPVSQSAVFMKHLRDRIKGETTATVPDTLPRNPDIPLMAEKRSVPTQLTRLTEHGTPMIIHPNQTIAQASGEPLDLTFVTAIGTIRGPRETAKQLLTRFEKFPDFVGQVASVSATETDTGFNANWSLSMGLGMLSVGIDYRLAYEWVSERSLKFHRIGGDLTHVYGALEWRATGDTETLFFYTTATQIGEKAGYIVQLGNMIPNKQIVIGVSAGALAVEKQIEWANEQISGKSSEPKDEGYF